MAELLGTPSKEDVQSDFEDLRKKFKPWREDHDDWDKMVFPDVDEDVVADRNRGRILSRAGEDRRMASQYRTNFVRVGVDNLINRLSRAEPKLETAVMNRDMDEISAGSKMERFGLGLFNVLNEQYSSTGVGTSWLRTVYSHFAHPGKGVARIQVRRGSDNQAQIFWDLLDPYLVFHDFTTNMRRLGYERHLSNFEAAAVLANFSADAQRGIPFTVEPRDIGSLGVEDDKGIAVGEYWIEKPDYDTGGAKVWSALLFDDQVMAMREMPVDHLPFVVVSANSLGRTYQKIDSSSVDNGNNVRPRDFIRRHAEPWFAPIQKTVELYNVVKTLEVEGVDLQIRPPLLMKSESGGWTLQDNRISGGVQIPLGPDQFMDFLQYNNQAIVANSTLVTSLEQELNRAYPLIGLLADVPGQSGFLFNLRTDEFELSVSEYARAASRFLEYGLQEVVHQFKKADGLKVALSGTDYRDNDAGTFFHEEFDSKDFPESTIMRVRLAPMLPKDDMRAIQIYQLATDPERGGLDELTGMAQILGINDPQSVKDRRLDDKIQKSETFITEAILRRMFEEADQLALEAEAEDDPIKHMRIRRAAIRAKIRAEQEEVRLTGQAQASPQMTAQPGRPSPEVQPPEQRGIENPDMQNIAGPQNVPPGGRPPTNGRGPL